MQTLKSPRIVYKGAWATINTGSTGSRTPVLVVLQVPKGARVNGKLDEYGKNRASSAKVLAIESVDGKTQYKHAYARGNFKYTVGTIARPLDSFDQSSEECSRGIHFYITRRDALGWVNVHAGNGTDPQYAAVLTDLRALNTAKAAAQARVLTLEAKLANARAALA